VPVPRVVDGVRGVGDNVHRGMKTFLKFQVMLVRVARLRENRVKSPTSETPMVG